MNGNILSSTIQSDNIADLTKALIEVQKAVASVGKDKANAFLGNRYATLGAVIDATRQPCLENGLVVAQDILGDGGQVGVRTRLLHVSGQWLASEAFIAINQEKGKSEAQVAVSNSSYLRRVALMALFNLYADDDLDGNGVGTKGSPAVKAEPKAPKAVLLPVFTAYAPLIAPLPWADGITHWLNAQVSATPDALAQATTKIAQVAALYASATNYWNGKAAEKLTEGLKAKGMQELPVELDNAVLAEMREKIETAIAAAAAKAAAK